MTTPLVQSQGLGRGVKLGRRTPTPEQRAAALPFVPFVRRYGAAPPPAECDWSKHAATVLARMYANDQFGDCVIAMHAHGFGVQSAADLQRAGIEFGDREVIAAYQHYCGPGDNGCFMLDVMRAMMTSGLLSGQVHHKIDGFASIPCQDEYAQKVGCHLLGGLFLGFNCPREWVHQARQGFEWRPSATPIIGGHAVYVYGYDAKGLKVSTWGVTGWLMWEAVRDRRYLDECYVCFGTDWYNDDKLGPGGIDVPALIAALAEFRAGRVPPIPEPAPPTPPTPPTPPAPTPGALVIDLKGELDAVLAKLPLALRGSITPSLSMLPRIEWFPLVREIFALLAAVRARDWNAALAALTRIIELLGVRLTDGQRAELRRAVESGSLGGSMPLYPRDPADHTDQI